MLNQVKFDLYQATLEKQSDDSNVIMPMPVPDTESDAMGYLQRLLSPKLEGYRMQAFRQTTKPHRKQ